MANSEEKNKKVGTKPGAEFYKNLQKLRVVLYESSTQH